MHACMHIIVHRIMILPPLTEQARPRMQASPYPSTHRAAVSACTCGRAAAGMLAPVHSMSTRRCMYIFQVATAVWPFAHFAFGRMHLEADPDPRTTVHRAPAVVLAEHYRDVTRGGNRCPNADPPHTHAVALFDTAPETVCRLWH